MSNIEKRICRNCDEEYEPTKSWQKFCHPDCRIKYHSQQKNLFARMNRLEKRVEDIEEKLSKILNI